MPQVQVRTASALATGYTRRARSCPPLQCSVLLLQNQLPKECKGAPRGREDKRIHAIARSRPALQQRQGIGRSLAAASGCHGDAVAARKHRGDCGGLHLWPRRSEMHMLVSFKPLYAWLCRQSLVVAQPVQV